MNEQTAGDQPNVAKMETEIAKLLVGQRFDWRSVNDSKNFEIIGEGRRILAIFDRPIRFLEIIFYVGVQTAKSQDIIHIHTSG